MSPAWKTLTRTLLVIAGTLLAMTIVIPLGESLEWPGFNGHGYLTLLLVFVGTLCGELGAWLRLAGPRAAKHAGRLGHLLLWVALPLAFAGCLAQLSMQVRKAVLSMDEA